MADTGRRVAIAIGVAEAKPAPYLSGALNGAHGFAAWAEAKKYETRLITDEDGPVTIAGLQAAIEAALAPPPAQDGSPTQDGHISRLLLYFAGHGLIREAEEGLWLLSDWHKELRAVAVEPLRRRLYRYDIDQIGIIADACRSLPADLDAADLTPDAVLGRGPLDSPKSPWIDRFTAAQDDTVTFMIPGADPEDDRCVFSGVLLQGLWGAQAGAFSKSVKGAVTSRSLGAYLQSEVARVAKTYDRDLSPSIATSFPEEDDVYVSKSDKLTPPAFPPWPPKSDLVSQAIAPPTASPPPPTRRMLRRALPIGPRPDAVIGAVFNSVRWPFGRGRDAIAKPEAEPVRPPVAERLRTQSSPTHFETGCGLAIEGAEVKSAWSRPDIAIEADQPGWFRVGGPAGAYLHQSAPLLFEMSDGLWLAGAALPRFILSAIWEPGRGVSGMVYRETWSAPSSSEGAEEAIAKLEAGALRGDEARDLSVKLRSNKHVDPVLGVISAYLYDGLGDMDSIRRMAFFYVQRNQPIPYDIALLGQLDTKLENGQLIAAVPPVKARKALTKAEQDAHWSHCATDGVSGPVGGFWPWMRQGWAFLDEAVDDGSALADPALLEVRAHLAPGRFTSLRKPGGPLLAKRLGLVKRL